MSEIVRTNERDRKRELFNEASPFKNRVVVTVQGIWSKRIIFRGDVLRIRSVHFKSTISSLLLLVLESWESKSKQIVIVDGKQVVINVVVVVIVVVIVVVFFLSFLNSPIF